MVELDKIESLPVLLRVLEKEEIPSKEHRKYMNMYLDFKARRQGVPLSGVFELTPLCNLDCKMCYVHLQKDQLKDSKILTTEEWKNLMKQAVDCGMMHADLSGGECLTYPGFDELYLYLRNLGVKISVKTNGVLLDEDRIAFFKKYPPSGIQISVYGSSEEAYERVTGKRKYSVVISNVLKAHEAKLPIRIAITPSKYMIDAKDIVKWAQEKDLPYVLNAGIFDPREDTGRAGQELDMSLDGYIDILKYIHSLKGITLVPEDSRELEDVPTKRNASSVGLRCAAGRSSFEIDWKGCLFACCNIRSVFSDPLEKGFSAAWRDVNEKAKRYVLPIECDTCKDYDRCIKCAAAHQDAPYGHVNQTICERTRRMTAEGLR